MSISLKIETSDRSSIINFQTPNKLDDSLFAKRYLLYRTLFETGPFRLRNSWCK